MEKQQFIYRVRFFKWDEEGPIMQVKFYNKIDLKPFMKSMKELINYDYVLIKESI